MDKIVVFCCEIELRSISMSANMYTFLHIHIMYHVHSHCEIMVIPIS